MNCFLMDSLQEALSRRQLPDSFAPSSSSSSTLQTIQFNSSLALFVFCPTAAAACEHVLLTTLFASFGLLVDEEDDDDDEGFSC